MFISCFSKYLILKHLICTSILMLDNHREENIFFIVYFGRVISVSMFDLFVHDMNSENELKQPIIDKYVRFQTEKFVVFCYCHRNTGYIKKTGAKCQGCTHFLEKGYSYPIFTLLFPLHHVSSIISRRFQNGNLLIPILLCSLRKQSQNSHTQLYTASF